MQQETSLPRIRQTLFWIEKNLSYKFDVNQDIRIKSLKKMIASAANISKSGMRIFHKEIEYTDYDDSTLDELFPNSQLVEFTISIRTVDENHTQGSNIKVKFGKYCPRHEYKYPYFYCYSCAMSICSICLVDHKSHNYIEKYDYFQSSKHLVESIFQDLMNDFSGDKSRRLDESTLKEMKEKVKVQYSSHLMEMIAKIEAKQLDLLDFFFETENQSLTNMRQNVGLIKSHCSEGLDRLKSEISIEEMMLDEDIFLTFDRKFREITFEKSRIVNDSNKFEKFKAGLDEVLKVIETIHNEIFIFLEKYVNSSLQNELKLRITESHVPLVSKDEIIGKLLSDVKRKSHGKSRVESFITTPTPEIDFGPVLAQCIQGTKDIVVYDNMNSNILRKTVQFPQLLGVDSFPSYCSWINVGGKLYVSGGLVKDRGSNTINPTEVFFYYDSMTGTITKLPDLPAARHSHSMIFHPQSSSIYFVGGGVSESHEFDTKTFQWTKLSNLNVEDRMNPVLFIGPNAYLYAFFGTSKGNYIDSVERLNTKNPKAKWEIVAYSKKVKDLNLKMIGCGIIHNGEGEIYLVGGKGKEGLVSSAVKFDFSNTSFDKLDLTLDEGIYFHESQLANLGSQSFGQFNAGKPENFFKIQYG